MEKKAFGLRISIITRAMSIMERRKEGRNNQKEYHSINRVRKVRSGIVALYYNILKVS